MTFSYQATNRYINYTYDAGGNLVRKQAFDNNTLQTTTDYVDGFVYIKVTTGTSTLSYFPMPEGRVLNNSGTMVQEFVIADQQGNARISFKDSGNGTPVVTQENSYYAFGLVMPNSPVALPATPNKQLYNGGSEWQNDYSNLPDYYQTFNRNYDAAIGRFIGVDPKAEKSNSMSPYQYCANNPIMFNDPLGDKEALSVYPLDDNGDDDGSFAGESGGGGGGGGGSGGDGGGGSGGGYGSFGGDNGGFSGGDGSFGGSQTDANTFQNQSQINSTTTGFFTNVVDQTGKVIQHIDDGSNAVFNYDENGNLAFVKWDPSQNGQNVINAATVADLNKLMEQTVTVSASRITRGEEINYDKIGSAITTGTDSYGVALSKANVINTVLTGTKIEGKAFKYLTGSGTIVGAIAGGIPAAISIYNNGLNWRNGTAAGVAILGVVSEFTGLGEAWDGTVGFVIVAGSLSFDIWDATHPVK